MVPRVPRRPTPAPLVPTALLGSRRRRTVTLAEIVAMDMSCTSCKIRVVPGC
jgi:hypothetical protein